MIRLPTLLLASLLAAPLSAQNQTQRFAATRDLRVGSVDDPDYTLTWMVGARLAPDASIYTLHYTEKTVRHFDPAGKLIGKFGRGGSGPGEFNNPAGLAWRSDSLYVFDSVDRRFSFFGGDGTFKRSVTVPPRSGEPGRGASPRQLLADGSVLGSITLEEVRDQLGGVGATNVAAVRLNRDGHVLDTLAKYSMKNGTMVITDGNDPPRWRSFTRQAFSDALLMGVAADANSLYFIDRPIADNDREGFFTIKRVGLDGRTLSTRRYSYIPQKVTQQQLDTIIAGHARNLSNPSGGRAATMTAASAAEAVKKALFVPKYHPPIQEVVAGADGTIWLKREDLQKTLVSWMIIGARGDMVGVVDLPRRFRMLDATLAQVIGEEYDELDVPYLARYRIKPRTVER